MYHCSLLLSVIDPSAQARCHLKANDVCNVCKMHISHSDPELLEAALVI